MEYLNTKILNYRLTRFIGEGGMASVYEGTHEKLGTKVAIKILNPVLSANKQIRQRFENEARMMASLNHPSITRVMDYDEQQEKLAIVMELLDGTNLASFIKTKGALKPEQAIPIFIQVLDAFIYAHGKGIVHRDIKPSNIFIDDDKQIKVLDFGIAKIFGAGDDFTSTGTQLGTPTYMSPEQVKAEKNIDQRTDIYSLGVTLFFLLNGKPPYDSSTQSNFEIFNKIVYEPIPDLKNYPEINAIIKTAVAKDRNQRFPDANAFKNAITNLKLPGATFIDNKTLVDSQEVSEPKPKSSDDDPTLIDKQGIKTKPDKNQNQQGSAKGIKEDESSFKDKTSETARSEHQNAFQSEIIKTLNGDIKIKEPEPKITLSPKQANYQDDATLIEKDGSKGEKPKVDYGQDFEKHVKEADAFFRNKQFKDAKNAYLQALNYNIDDSHSRVQVAICKLEQSKKFQKKAIYFAVIITVIIWTGYFIKQSLNPSPDEVSDQQPSELVFDYPTVFIPGGTFQMGDNDSYPEDEKPVHVVTLSDFNLGKYEVTQKNWQQVIGNNPSKFEGCDSCPVERVSWKDIQEFIKVLNQKTGKIYRLPTEAEWEYAAGGGISTSSSLRQKYAGTNNGDDLTAFAWFKENSDSITHPVGMKKPNLLGIYDMSGNVYEWCSDWYDDYPAEPQVNPTGSVAGQYHVLRGGSWTYFNYYCRVAHRRGNVSDDRRQSSCGFRLVLEK